MLLKFITGFNWVMLFSLGLFLLYVLLNDNAVSADLAGKGMVQGYALVGLILLGLLLFINLLPFRWTRIGVFVVLCWPTVVAVVQLITKAIDTPRKP